MTGNCYVGGSYRGLLSLVRHSKNDGAVGIFWIIVSAVCHLRTLQITGYFGKEDKSTKSILGANQLFIGGVLVDILQLLRYNTHSILVCTVGLQKRLHRFTVVLCFAYLVTHFFAVTLW